MRLPWTGIGIMAVAALAGHVRTARADTHEQQPWTVGVSAAQKVDAQALLDAGNELFLARKYAEAIEKYRAAVKTWDHPAIRFNLVRCLIQLEKPLEAFDELELALKYDGAPFDESIYNEALAYQKLLGNQISELKVTCKQDGLTLTLDGQPLPACPSTQLRRVLPGPHQIVGKKAGFVTKTVELNVIGGKRSTAAIEVIPITMLTRGAHVEHRWPQWLPWTVFASGFALAGAAELFHLAAVSNQDDYRALVSKTCTTGCNAAELDHSLESRAELENNIAIGVLSVGAAVVITGGVMLILNRGTTVYEAEKEQPASRVGITPTRGGGAITWSRTF
jgi:tetratricopeptide (TPR) repeat protein